MTRATRASSETDAPAQKAAAPAAQPTAEPTAAAAGEPTTAPAAENDGLVEVELTAHLRHDGEEYLPGDKIRVTAERAAALRWAGRAKR